MSRSDIWFMAQMQTTGHELLLTLEKRKGGAAPDRAAAPWLGG